MPDWARFVTRVRVSHNASYRTRGVTDLAHQTRTDDWPPRCSCGAESDAVVTVIVDAYSERGRELIDWNGPIAKNARTAFCGDCLIKWRDEAAAELAKDAPIGVSILSSEGGS